MLWMGRLFWCIVPEVLPLHDPCHRVLGAELGSQVCGVDLFELIIVVSTFRVEYLEDLLCCSCVDHDLFLRQMAASRCVLSGR